MHHLTLTSKGRAAIRGGIRFCGRHHLASNRNRTDCAEVEANLSFVTSVIYEVSFELAAQRGIGCAKARAAEKKGHNKPSCSVSISTNRSRLFVL
jgi:hypothetical protein